MSGKTFFFAGGGTGGHIYPALAVAEQINKLTPDAKIYFFAGSRDIDKRILDQTPYEYTILPAKGFSIKPKPFVDFWKSFRKSVQIATQTISENQSPHVIGVGGFVAAPTCWAAHKLNVPIALLNVDSVPGKANKIISRWANEIFLQFEDTAHYFAKQKAAINVFGCPLRESFENPNPDTILQKLDLDRNKKTLVITGASSGAKSINETVCSLLPMLDDFAADWQIVHLTGIRNFDHVKREYANAKIGHVVLDYCEDMADLLAVADLVIARSGAVSVAEFIAAAAPAICMPYPHHKDKHQYLNAAKMVEAAAAIIVDDLPDAKERSEWLAEELRDLMTDDQKRAEMKKACQRIATKNAAQKIAEKLIGNN